jgi:hypothetical protein
MFREPSAAAFGPGRTIVVSDTDAFDHGGLLFVDPEGGQQTKIAASTVFHRPFGIVCDPEGQIFVAYVGSVETVGTVMRVNPANGEHKAVAPGVHFFRPAGVALDAARNVIITEPDEAGSDSRLHRVDQGVGASILAINSPPGSIYASVVIEPSGNLVVVNAPNHSPQQVLRFHPVTGAPAKVSEGQKLVAPIGVALEASGAILVADGRSGVIRIDPVSGAQTVVSSGGSFARPLGVAVKP